MPRARLDPSRAAGPVVLADRRSGALDEPRRAQLLARIEAVRLYVAHTPLKTIESSTGVPRSALFHLVRRCIKPHPDGRIRGFRALIPFARVKDYERIKPVAPTTRTRTSGSSGAMTRRLLQHPSLTLVLRRCLSERDAYIGAAGQLCGLHTVYGVFLNACRELGLTVADYPFNQDRQGIRSLAKAIQRLAMQSFAGAARAAGAERVSAP